MALAVCGAAVGAGPAAAAPTDFTWSGADTATPTPNWSDPENWVGGVAPANSSTIGTLTFPPLTSADCMSATPVGTCYVSQNDRTNLTVGKLAFNTSAAGYTIGGNPITLDGGLTTEQGSNFFGRVSLTTPITLGANQTWNVDSELDLGTYSPVAVSGNHALTVNVANSHQFWIYGGIEAGALSINGGQVNVASDLNATSGGAVMLTHSTFIGYGGLVGALSSFGSTIALSPPGLGYPRSLHATSVTLDSHSKLGMSSGEELISTGPVNLGGATLGLAGLYHFPCTAPTGTLVSTTGTLTGSFGNAPNGGRYWDGCDYLRIRYQRSGSTKTVTSTLIGSPTRTSLSASTLPVTNQQVILTATIDTPEPPGYLLGTVSFEHGRKTIKGCGAQSITYLGSSNAYAASCQTSFAAASSPVALSAEFAPAAGWPYLPSTGTTRLTVAKAATSTAAGISSRKPAVGARVTYTATVTPAYAGRAKPSGSVEFLDRGKPIESCERQPLTARRSVSTAKCTLLHAAAGSHSISAKYAGDANFTASASGAQAVAVTAAAWVRTW